MNGDQVSYDASNMLDGVPETAWRTAGNAAGMTLAFTLADPTELHEVGLINGYAKTSTDSQGRTYDWYAGNRRIKAVVWEFDDNTKVRQQLKDSRDLQMLDVPDVVTSKVMLRLVSVSKPGTRPRVEGLHRDQRGLARRRPGLEGDPSGKSSAAPQPRAPHRPGRCRGG